MGIAYYWSAYEGIKKINSDNLWEVPSQMGPTQPFKLDVYK